jgi:hypothetical protein
MTEDRFKPPSAYVDDPRRGKGSPIKGVLLGLVVDVGGTMLFGIAVSIAWGFALAAAGHSAQEIKALFANPDGDPVLPTVLIGGGVLCSVLGGYVCERIARQANYRLGLVLSTLSVLVGVALGSTAASATMFVLLTVLTVGSVLLGTRLAFQENAAMRVEP